MIGPGCLVADSQNGTLQIGSETTHLVANSQNRTEVNEVRKPSLLYLQPLKGEIDPEASTFSIGKVKIEIKIVKRVFGRWGSLVGDSPDGML